MTKYQYPNNNQYPNPKNQTLFDYWVIGAYLELGIWLLGVH
jgi:hypothetical protein